MTKNALDFDSILKKIRNKSFGILNTTSSEGGLNSSSILFGVSMPEKRFRIYILSNQTKRMIGNVKYNYSASLAIPLCNRIFCFLPFSTVYFESNAEIIPYDDPNAQEIYQKKRILKKVFKEASKSNERNDLLFLRLKPKKKALIFRPGFSFLRSKRTHYIIQIPSGKY